MDHDRLFILLPLRLIGQIKSAQARALTGYGGIKHAQCSFAVNRHMAM